MWISIARLVILLLIIVTACQAAKSNGGKRWRRRLRRYYYRVEQFQLRPIQLKSHQCWRVRNKESDPRCIGPTTLPPTPPPPTTTPPPQFTTTNVVKFATRWTPVGGVMAYGGYVYDTERSSSEVSEFEVTDTTITKLRAVVISGISACYKGLVVHNGVVFVSAFTNYKILKIDLATGGALPLISTTGCDVAFISLSSANTLILACNSEDKIEERQLDGTLLQTVNLPSGFQNSYQAQKLSNGHFIASTSTPPDVIKFDAGGNVVARYSQPTLPATGALNNPRGLHVLDDGRVLVADQDNNRVLLVDASLSSAEVAPLQVSPALNQPWTVHYDKFQSRIIVGELGGKRFLTFFMA